MMDSIANMLLDVKYLITGYMNGTMVCTNKNDGKL
jgi:hypothetical protein